MASGLPGVVLLVLCVALGPRVSAENCKSFRDDYNTYHGYQYCYTGFCCGTCTRRYCCSNSILQLSDDKQDDCEDDIFHSSSNTLSIVIGVSFLAIGIFIFICCCVCPCCCLYNMCRRPQPVIATTHTTVVAPPQHYPQQPMASARQPQAHQPYQPIPVQPGYGNQPMHQAYGGHPMPTTPYPPQQFTPGPPPPSYQEATGPGYPPNTMPYSQAAFTPSQPAYPLAPPAQPGSQPPPPHTDFLTQPAYNPSYVAP